MDIVRLWAFSQRDHSENTFVEGKEGGSHWKANKNEQGEGEGPNICVRSLFKKKMLRFSKWSFIVILQFFLLVIMAVWNIKQTIMKDYNIQSCQWMALDDFYQPFLLCTTFHSFLCTFSAKNGYLFSGYR